MPGLNQLDSEKQKSGESVSVVAGLSGASKVYSGGAEEIHALCDIDLEIEEGELVAVLGPSGSGKSTLLHILGLLDRPTSGGLVFLGEDAMSMKERRKAWLRSREIGFVFQSFHLLPRLSARANVMLPLLYAGFKRSEARDFALRALDLVGLSRRSEHLPEELSGGESQRTAIARAMVSGPSLVLADEPTGNLDKKTGGAILDLFSDLNRSKGTTMILVSHDPDVAARCGRRISIDDGRIKGDERS